MESVLAGASALLIILGAVFAGVWLAKRLPDEHLATESRTAVSVSMAVVGTLSALVLSLLISNASTSFNNRVLAGETLALDVVKLDYVLDRYGPGASEARVLLRSYAVAKLREMSGQDRVPGLGLTALRMLGDVGDAIMSLQPQDARDRSLQQRALTLADAIADARWQMAEATGSPVPYAFLAVLVAWLSLLFASFGLFAPRNLTVLAVLSVGALAVAGGIVMILELGNPSSRLIRPAALPMDRAVQQIAAPGT